MRDYAAVEEDVSTEEGWRRLRAHYFANVNLVDRMVGRITSAIDDAGVADDTVVVFTSDHGDMLGDHGMLEKRSMYDESSRVPMLMRVPWLSREQTTVPGSMSHIDLAPTVLDLLGDPVPYHMQGKSLVPTLSSGASLEDNDVFIEWNGFFSSMPDRHLGTAAIDRMNRLRGAPSCPADGSSTCAWATSASCSTWTTTHTRCATCSTTQPSATASATSRRAYATGRSRRTTTRRCHQYEVSNDRHRPSPPPPVAPAQSLPSRRRGRESIPGPVHPHAR